MVDVQQLSLSGDDKLCRTADSGGLAFHKTAKPPEFCLNEP